MKIQPRPASVLTLYWELIEIEHRHTFATEPVQKCSLFIYSETT